MKKRLVNFSLHQSSKALAFLNFIMFAVIFWSIALLTLIRGYEVIADPNNEMGFGTFLILMFIAPFFYGVLSYIVCIFYLWIYNIAAKFSGGIEVEVENHD